MFGTNSSQSQAPGIRSLFFGGVRASHHFCLSQDYQAGEVMVYLTGLTTGPKSYATLQCGPGPDDHVLPPSDLVYGVPRVLNALIIRQTCAYSRLQTFYATAVNHSCDPNAAFNLYCPDRAKWHMYALKRIAVGDPGQQLLPVLSPHSPPTFDDWFGAFLASHILLSEHRVVGGPAV